MPLTVFQQEVLRLLARFRSPDSYVAGATVVNRGPETPRYSDDIDIFHEAEEAVVRAAEADGNVLREHGYDLIWLLQRPGFYRATASKGAEAVRMDWAVDSAFRFFPVEADELLGFRLHTFDGATNKVLALAGRREARDFIDVLHLHRSYLSLGAICWAAAAKDPGFTPELLLAELGRNGSFRAEEFGVLALEEPPDLTSLKREWLAALGQARELLHLLPPDDAGCVYLDEKSNPVTPQDAAQLQSLRRHWGMVRGSWPSIAP